MVPMENSANGVTGLERVGLELTWYYDHNTCAGELASIPRTKLISSEELPFELHNV